MIHVLPTETQASNTLRFDFAPYNDLSDTVELSTMLNDERTNGRPTVDLSMYARPLTPTSPARSTHRIYGAFCYRGRL